jgi:uncharacterized protein (TIGR02597 family)
MKRSLLLSAAAATSFILAHGASAQSVVTDPVGFTTLTCPASSDTFVSVPFTRPPEFVGATASATANTITVSGSPWTVNQFVYVAGSQPKTYFVLIGPHTSTNPKEGLVYQITSNTANTLTVNAGGDDLSSIVAATQILVIPYHTLASVFPASDAGVSFIISPSSINRQTQLLIPNYSGVGINLAPSVTYFYFNSAWRRFGSPLTEDHSDDPIVNAGYFTLRNAATGTTLTTLGSVLTKNTTIPLFTRVGATSVTQDNFVSVIRPIDVKLNDLGLITSGAFLSSPSSINRIDQLLAFDNAQVAINKSPSSTYYYLNSAWRKFGQPTTTDFGNDTIAAGTGFIIRKGGTPAGATSLWKNSPTY